MTLLLLLFRLHGLVLLADAVFGTLWDFATMPADDRVELIIMAIDAMKAIAARIREAKYGVRP
jgi:hypothetical protein